MERRVEGGARFISGIENAGEEKIRRGRRKVEGGLKSRIENAGDEAMEPGRCREEVGLKSKIEISEERRMIERSGWRMDGNWKSQVKNAG